MVSVVSGSGLGLFGSVLRGASLAGVGQGSEQVYVNSATGNLVIQGEDERLRGLGLSTSWTRTYNSQGLMEDDNGDNWRLGAHQRVYQLTGSLNQAGSTVTKVFGDGHEARYQYDTGRGVYMSTAGDGAHDTLSHSGGQWTWTEGSDRTTELYSSEGRLLQAADRDGHTVSYQYTGDLLTQVTDASGQVTYLDYHAGGRNLAQIRVVSNGTTQIRTRYDYDALHRLSAVRVDLTPEDNQVADAREFITRYTYEGTSRRLTSLSQSDGSTVSFTYRQGNDGAYRVSSYTEGTGSAARTTHFSYSLPENTAVASSGVGQAVPGEEISTAGDPAEVPPPAQGVPVPGGLRTQITDALGNVTTQVHDQHGRLISLQGPLSRTDYSHDADGNLIALIEDAQGVARTTVFEYDRDGNLIYSRDAAGQTLRRTYDARNQLLTETRYRAADSDGSGAIQPSQPLTTRYAYGTRGQLRFTVSAAGRVTEFQYNPLGLRTLSLTYTVSSYPVAGLDALASLSEAQLMSWASAQSRSNLERVEFAYDFRAQLASRTSYGATDVNGAGIATTASRTQYVYSQEGQLLQSLTALGAELTPNPADTTLAHATTYYYDGLGRLTLTTQRVSAGATQTTLTEYDDAGSRIVTTLGNGLVQTRTFDSRGALLSEVDAAGVSVLGETRYTYDAKGRVQRIENGAGGSQHLLYDAQDRRIAQIDGLGRVVQFVYDGAGALIKTVRYADALERTALASLTAASGEPTLESLLASLPATIGRVHDQVTRTVRDDAGRAVFEIDAGGALRQFFYDGAGWLTDEVQYAIPLSISAAAGVLRPEDISIEPDLEDRHSRTFYDSDGNVLARLDAAGFLTEYVLDGAGRIRRQISHANATAAELRAGGTLEQLRPMPDRDSTLDAEQDLISEFFYDGQGRPIAVLDAGGYLSETFYDAAGREAERRRYDQVLEFTGGTLANLKAQIAADTAVRSTRFAYDEAGQLTRQTDYDGTVSLFTLDAIGQRIATTVAAGTNDARTVQERRDALGRVVQRLSGEGSALLSATSSAAQIDAVWERYGVRYHYDAAGQLTSETRRPDDTRTLATWYFYDEQGELRYQVNADGEVLEKRYNALGQLTQSIAYSKRISVEGLGGGVITAVLNERVAAATDSAHDLHTHFSYTLNGQLKSTLSAGGALSTLSYTAFGAVSSKLEQLDAGHSLRTDYSYDARGLLTRTQLDPLGEDLQAVQRYDAFGRLTEVADVRGSVSRYEYDALGRQVTSIDALHGRRVTTYDAFSRELTVQDALGAVTRFVYDDADRSATVTTPEGIAVTTRNTAHGQTLTVSAAGNLTTYEYDRNGALTRVADALGTLESHTYDRGSRRVLSLDARGTRTTFSYDAADRVLTQTVDAGGLELRTTFEYDGRGQVSRLTEPGGRITTIAYDADGRVQHREIDPDGLNLRTAYEYDLGGRLVTVIEAAGSAQPRITSYRYDVLGRRVEQVVDPGAGKLNLTTRFAYDGSGNLTRRIDALGNTTWYVYDALNRQIQSVDATGAVRETRYDAAGRATLTHEYAARVAVSGFGEVVDAVVPLPSAQDRISQSLIDRDGRERFSIDAAGAVIERSFDERGNVIRTRAFARPVATSAYSSIEALRSALTAAGNDLSIPGPADRLEWSAYNLRGEQVFTVDAAGAVARLERDVAGTVIRTTAFATLRPTTLPMDIASLSAWAETSAIAGHPDNRVQRFWHDALGREEFALDAEGYLTRTIHNDTERATSRILYHQRLTLVPGVTLVQLRAHAVVTSFDSHRDHVSTTQQDVAGRTIAAFDAVSIDTAPAVERYEYDALGNRVVTIDPRGSLTRRTFDAAGREIAVTDPLGFVTTAIYDANGQRTVLIDGRGARGYTYYNNLGQVQYQIDPTGHVTELSYDSFGNVVREIVYATALHDAHDETTPASVIASRIAVDAARDRALTRSYEARGLLTRVTYIGSPTYSEVFRYNSFREKIQYTDRGGAVFDYEYDRRGLMVKEISPQIEVVTAATPTLTTQMLRLETVYEYTAFGERSAQHQAAGTAQQRTTTYRHDRLGREVRIQSPAFEVYDRTTNTSTLRTPETIHTYDAAGNLVVQIDPSGARTVNYYDSRNLLVATVDGVNAYSQFEYDAVGNRVRERIFGTRLSGTIDPAVVPEPLDPDDYRELTHEYNANNQRVLTATRAETLFSFALIEGSSAGYYTAAVVTLSEYDANGNVITTVSGNGNVTRSYHDAVGNKALSVDAAGYVTHWQYNAQGQVLRETHLAGQLSSEFRDTLTAATSIADILAAVPAGDDRITAFEYDVLGRRTEERKLSVSYTIINVSTGAPTTVTADVVTRYEYDGNGNLRAQTDAAGGRTEYSYDALGRKTGQLDPQFQGFVGRGQAVVTLRSQQLFRYDAHGNLVHQVTLGSSPAENREVSQQFDAAGNLRVRTEAGGARFSYDYDVSSNTVRASRTVRDVNNVTHQYRTYASFDLVNREVSRQDIEDEATSAQVHRETQDVRYNAYGDIEAKGINGQFQESYLYDRLGRVFFTNDKQTGAPTLFVYDADGNAVLRVKGVANDVRFVQEGPSVRPIRGPEDVKAFSPETDQFTLSLYDERDQLTTVLEAPMVFGTLLAAQPRVEGSRANAPDVEIAAAIGSLPTSLTLRNGVNGERAKPRIDDLNLKTDTVFRFGVPPSSGSERALDARFSVPPNFGVTTSAPVISGPVVTLVSDTDYPERDERVVIEDISRTIVTTTVEVQDQNGDGIYESVVKTAKTERPVTRRTTTFTRSRSETVAPDEAGLSGSITVATQEETRTTGSADIQTERTTRTDTTSVTGRYVYPDAAGAGVVNLLAAVPVTINIDYLRRGGRPRPVEIEEPIDIAIYINSPPIPGFGNSPAHIDVYGPFSPISQDFSNGIQLAESRAGVSGDTVGISISKGGYALLGISDAYDQTVTIGPFVSLKQLPPNANHAQLTLLDESGNAIAGPYNNAHAVQDGSGRELIFTQPYPNAFASGQRYQYTAFDVYGNAVSVVQGRLGSTERGDLFAQTTTTYTHQVTEHTANTAYSIDQSSSKPTNQKQVNYVLNLVRSITQGAENESIIERTQDYNAFGEVIGQTDGRRFTTRLSYNDLGSLVLEEQPETLIHPESGSAFRARPTTRYFYDQLGQLVGQEDANSVGLSAGRPYYNTRVLVNGRVEKEFDAAGGVTRHIHDVFGHERQQFDALGQETAFEYDPAGRLIRQSRYETNGVLHSSDTYRYDEDGNRIAHVNALGEQETYRYDGQGRIRSYTSFAGKQTRYDYNYLSALNSIGGYEKITTTDGINGPDTQVDHSTYFDQLVYHKDLGGHEFVYEYNHAGLLAHQQGTTAEAGRNAQEISYEYYLNGLLESVVDTGISSHARFQYDKNGNRIVEIYSKSDIVAGEQDVHPYQVAYAQYDELNRVQRIEEAGKFDVSYSYDAVGNRRRVQSNYYDLLTGNNQAQDFYYKYDHLNRFTVTLGTLDAAGQIARGTTGYDIEYDALGRRISATSELLSKSANVAQYVREVYGYDRIGTVKRVDVFNGAGARTGGSTRRNSALGSLETYTEFKVDSSGVETETRRVDYAYDRDQRVLNEITTLDGNTSRRDRTLYNYDGEGILTSTVANTIDQNGNVVNSADQVTVSYAYEKWDSYKESTVTVTAGAANTRSWRQGTSFYEYNGNGHISRLRDAQANRTIEYVNNHSGQVLKRYQIDREVNGSDKTPVVRSFYYLNGRGVGDTGTDRVESRVDYAQQLAEQEKKDKKGRTSQINPNIGQRVLPVTSADFDQNFQPINDSFPAKVAGTHVVQSSETLQSIAASMYGDASLWYLIADANGLTDDDQLVSGLRLTIPNVVSNVRNNAQTFRPYDVQAALGDTSPTLPPPPPPPRGKKGCGGLGTVLIAAVAIVATVYTAGLAASALAGLTASGVSGSTLALGSAALGGTLGTVGTAAVSIGAAVIGGAAGAIVSQGVAIAAGLQKGFDFKGVALAAVGAGVTAGLGAFAGGSSAAGFIGKFAQSNPYTYAALHGATANVLTQSISVATGLQKSFSWKNIAVSAVAAPVARAVGARATEFAGKVGVVGDVARFASRFASGIGGSLVRRALGGRTDTGTLVADAFGNAVGDAAVDGLSALAANSTSLAGGFSAAEDAIPEVEVIGKRIAADVVSRVVDEDALAGALSPSRGGQEPISGLDAQSKTPVIEELVVTARKFNYAENLEYDRLISPRSYVRPDGRFGGGLAGADDDYVSRLALRNVATNVRLQYENREQFAGVAHDFGLFLDTVSPFALGRRAVLDTANAAIHLAGGVAALPALLLGTERAARVRDTVEGLQIEYDSQFNAAVSTGLADDFEDLRSLSEDLIGVPATSVVGKGVEYLSDALVLIGGYSGIRNTGLASSIAEGSAIALGSGKALGFEIAEKIYGVAVEEFLVKTGGILYAVPPSKKFTTLFVNQVPDGLAREVADAARVGAKAIGPSHPAFESVINKGTVKFVVTESDELLVIPHTVKNIEISHAVLALGRPVRAAGQADIAGAGGRFFGVAISPHSGHYLNGATAEQSARSVSIGKEAFRRFGIEFGD